MTKKILTMAAAASLMAACSQQSVNEGVDYASMVNTFIGTDYTGNTYPGAQAPFGLVQLSPDNGLPGWDRIAGYFYPDSTIAGFSHTHLSGTGAGDLYDISFMPATVPWKEAPAPLGIYSSFSHSSEEASAGYYKVLLDDYNIMVELTATTRTGIQRYTFPGGQAAVFLNLAKAMNWDSTVDTDIKVVDSVTVEGYRFSAGWARDQRVFFRSRFSKPWQHLTIDTVATVSGGKGLRARFDFSTSDGEQIVVSTALSSVSEAGAALNLEAEAPTDDFEDARAAARNAWNAELGRIEVTASADSAATIFYTALYHSMLAPVVFSDVDGRYFGPDKKIHQMPDGQVFYTTFSLWDTFRASHPLFTLTDPGRVGDMVASMIAFYQQSGRLPVWNLWGGETDMMIGYHAVPVIVDAYLKGIGGFDAEAALEACVSSANADDYRGIGFYRANGYVPYDVVDPYNPDDWSMSRTLEYAFDDYCIALMAQKMGRKELAEEFFKRSQNYRNVFNPATTFMQPRDSKGRWQPAYSPDEYTPHICESNGWHYLWSVQHDIPGLMELMGGPDRFGEKLDSMFTYAPGADDDLPLFSTGMIGQYAHGNEPSHHVIYLFNKIRKPWLTAKYVDQVRRELYLNSPAGLCGNDDMGQTSAWYVLSALGFYPVTPVGGDYEIGAPMFDKAVLNLEDGKTFTITARNLSPENIYVQSVKVNGAPWIQSSISHAMIVAGGTLEFEMTSRPGICWFD